MNGAAKVPGNAESPAARDTVNVRVPREIAAQCPAKLSLILPGADDPEVDERCEKRLGHRDYHGTLGGYGWETSNSDRT